MIGFLKKIVIKAANPRAALPSVAIRPRVLDVNPFVERFSRAVEKAGYSTVEFRESLSEIIDYSAIIFHWPDEFFTPKRLAVSFRLLLKLRIAKLFGTKIIWVAHNRRAHDNDAHHQWIGAGFISLLDGVIYLSQSSRDLVRSDIAIPSSARELVTVHGTYRLADKREIVAAEGPVSLLNFGLVRPYKNIDVLVSAARAMDPSEAHLTVAGKRHDAVLAAKIEADIRTVGHITADFRDDIINDDELERMIDAHDGVVLPYRDILNSGSALQALSRNKPVLVPSTGSMPELQNDLGKEWIYLYEGSLNASHLRSFCERIRRDHRPTHPNLTAYSWQRVSDDLGPFLQLITKQ